MDNMKQCRDDTNQYIERITNALKGYVRQCIEKQCNISNALKGNTNSVMGDNSMQCVVIIWTI